jgi:NDP-sugar pyrophosphorylase family protein
MTYFVNASETKTETTKAQTHCPIRGGEIDKTSFTDYKGQRIYYCCQGCDKKFLKAPDKYIKEMKNKGIKFSPGEVEEWLDCGNKNATVYTNERVLEHNGNIISVTAVIENSEIIEPCFIGENAIIKNSTVGPHVAIGNNTSVENSVISKSIIQNETQIIDAKINNSMIGNKCFFDGKNTQQDVSIGDFSEVK